MFTYADQNIIYIFIYIKNIFYLNFSTQEDSHNNTNSIFFLTGAFHLKESLLVKKLNRLPSLNPKKQ